MLTRGIFPDDITRLFGGKPSTSSSVPFDAVTDCSRMVVAVTINVITLGLVLNSLSIISYEKLHEENDFDSNIDTKITVGRVYL